MEDRDSALCSAHSRPCRHSSVLQSQCLSKPLCRLCIGEWGSEAPSLTSRETQLATTTVVLSQSNRNGGLRYAVRPTSTCSARSIGIGGQPHVKEGEEREIVEQRISKRRRSSVNTLQSSFGGTVARDAGAKPDPARR